MWAPLILLVQVTVLLDISCAMLTNTADKAGNIHSVVKNTDGSLVDISQRRMNINKRVFTEVEESNIPLGPDSPLERFKRINKRNINSDEEKPLVRVRRGDNQDINDLIGGSLGMKSRKERDIHVPDNSDQPLVRVKRNVDDPLERAKRDFPDQPLEWVKRDQMDKTMNRKKRHSDDDDNTVELNKMKTRSKRDYEASEIKENPVFDVREYIQKMHRAKRSDAKAQQSILRSKGNDQKTKKQ